MSAPCQSRSRARLRAASFAAGTALGLLVGSPAAQAASRAEPEPDVSAWVGRYCTPLGCRGARGAALVDALGFGAAAGALALLARRRRA